MLKKNIIARKRIRNAQELLREFKTKCSDKTNKKDRHVQTRIDNF
jgi:uncharacterized membrane protein (DUF106 family)